MSNFYLEIGVRSEGTLKPEDIASALIHDAESIPEESFSPSLLSDLRAIIEDDHLDHIWEVIQDAIDELQGYCPPYCYYGSLDGDGACIGVFPDIEQVEQAVRDGEIHEVSDLADIDALDPAPQVGDLVVIVNDHGNMTLSRIEASTKEIWSVV